ncbi:MAG: ribbon-helix-helix protein, CopG family [Oscillospiraceae bacterium]|nr:ribbon-helix-helix protein, CopG family [Oscillospiraceae bacterium]
MSPKTGRPTDNPKPYRISARLDEECKQILTKYCEQENVNQMEALRRAIKKLESDLNYK